MSLDAGITYKKTLSEKYTLKGDVWWAIFVIDEADGLFSCQSDWGDYTYRWPRHGRESFKHFLIEISRDEDYFLKKTCERNYFDMNKTMKKWKKAICDTRKERFTCTKEEARDAWDFVEGLSDYAGNAEAIQREVCCSDELRAIVGDEPWYVFDIDMDFTPGQKIFFNRVFKAFAEILKQEIIDTKKAAALKTASELCDISLCKIHPDACGTEKCPIKKEV